MPAVSTPEARALLVVMAVVLATAAMYTVVNAYERLAAADARAGSAVGAAHELKEKVDELESQLEELRDKLDERR